MLANLNDVLIPAKNGKYGVGLFNTVSLEMARGVLAAAEETQSPVIIGTAEALLPVCDLENLAHIIIPMAEKAPVPVVVHFDHGLTFDNCIKALSLGFTSVMYDCSTLSYEENLEKVCELAEIAHAKGATIEAELGHVGDATGESLQSDPSAFYTDPAQASEYVKATKADALAIAVGTAHGAYNFPPKLDFERIKAIAAVTPVPLVLHGGSGLSDDDFRNAVKCGISKINIFTDINIAMARGMQTALSSGKKEATDIIPYEIDAVRAETAKKMKLFAGE